MLAVTTSSLLPPPFPLMPVSARCRRLGRFTKEVSLSFSLARAFRYALVAWLAAAYGTHDGPCLSPLSRRLEHHLHVGVSGSGGGRYFVWVLEVPQESSAANRAADRCAQRREVGRKFFYPSSRPLPTLSLRTHKGQSGRGAQAEAMVGLRPSSVIPRTLGRTWGTLCYSVYIGGGDDMCRRPVTPSSEACPRSSRDCIANRKSIFPSGAGTRLR